LAAYAQLSGGAGRTRTADHNVLVSMSVDYHEPDLANSNSERSQSRATAPGSMLGRGGELSWSDTAEEAQSAVDALALG
jgi:hypothetical protein